MIHSPRTWPALAGIVAGALLLAACIGASPNLSGASESAAPSVVPVSGTLKISGSSTVQPITSIVAEDFQTLNPDVDYTVDGPGTGDGFALFCNGETDINDASRTIKDEEKAACQAKGINWIELQVGIDGITVMTSPNNAAVTCLSFLDLYALIGPESEGFAKWSDASALAGELGSLTGSHGASHAPYPDVALDITAPGEESGTYDTFVGFALTAIAGERGKDAAARPDYTASGDDNVIIEGIAGSDSSLGWVGFAFADQNKDKVRAVEIDGGSGCMAPNDDTIASGDYPMSRPLFIYVNTDEADSNPALQAFVDYYLSDAGIAAVTEADYIAMPQDKLDASRSAWTSR